jgi:hypothetical protein
MSGLLVDIRSVGTGVRDRALDFVAMVRRTAPGPALTRLAAAVAAMAALVVAAPSGLRSVAWYGVGAVVAAGAGLFPRTRWITIVLLLAVIEWLVATIGYGGEVTLARTGLLAAALYVTHSAAALAAVLPYDAVVAPGVLLRWLIRTGAIVVVSLAVALGAMAVLQELQPVPTLAAPVIGAIVAAALAGLLAWHVRRR